MCVCVCMFERDAKGAAANIAAVMCVSKVCMYACVCTCACACVCVCVYVCVRECIRQTFEYR